jgi:tRNA(Ile)-lysidine synthase
VNSRKTDESPRDNPGYRLSRKVTEFAAFHHLWKEGERIMVAVSGGADSVALLHILHGLSPILDLELTVVHLDHGLRGQVSQDDARWVEELTRRLNIPYIGGRRDPASEVEEGGRSPEEAARIARYAFFREVSDRTGITTIALAHHADDQAETVLMKLLRGCSPAGLGGMRVSRREGPLRIVRPLLSARRWELREFLTSIGESFREDLSNRDCRFLRNRIRHELLPLMEKEYNPKIKEGLIHLAGMVRDRDDYLLDRLGDTFSLVVSKTDDGIKIDCKRFSTLPDFEQGEVLRQVLWEAGVNDPRRSYFKDIKRSIAGPSGSCLDLAGGVMAFRKDDNLIINTGLSTNCIEPLTPLELPIPGEIIIESIGAKITVRQYCRPRLLEFKQTVNLKQYWENYPEGGDLKEYLDGDQVIEPIMVRSRLPGDRYRPLSMPGSRKIKDILIDDKVAASIRDSIPVLEDAEGIIWLAGYRPAHRCRIRKETRNILEISLIPV